MQSDIQGYFDCLPKHHSCLLKHPEKHHYINSSNGIIILSGMSSDVSHPAGVGFLWKEAVGMSQRLRGRVGAGSEMLSSQNLVDAQDGGWMHHAVTPHQWLRHNPFSQRHGTPTAASSALIHWILRRHFFATANQSEELTRIFLLNNLGFSLKMQAGFSRKYKA